MGATTNNATRAAAFGDGNNPSRLVNKTVDLVDTSFMLPTIAPRTPNWDGYAHYHVQTRRGLKNAAKNDWADRVVAHWQAGGFLGQIGMGQHLNVTAANELRAYKAGWLIGASAAAMNDAIAAFNPDVNIGLA